PPLRLRPIMARARPITAHRPRPRPAAIGSSTAIGTATPGISAPCGFATELNDRHRNAAKSPAEKSAGLFVYAPHPDEPPLAGVWKGEATARASWFETRQRVRAKRGPMTGSVALLTMRDHPPSLASTSSR